MTREEQIIKASQLYTKPLQKLFMEGAMWADRNSQNLWHDAQGDDLPEIDEEVIVLCQDYEDDKEHLRVCFAHRPNKKGYLGKSLVTGNVETFYPRTYGKGGWNLPNIVWWLDVELPKMEEQQ